MRKLDNWLQSYLEYTSNSESPETFHTWVGLSVIASAIRRNISDDRGTFICYPNMYIVLVSPPATARKSSSMNLGHKLLRHVPGIRIGPPSVTKAQLVRLMSKSFDKTQSAMTILTPELSSLIPPSGGVEMVHFLTVIYDCEFAEDYEHATKTQGKDRIQNPVLNMIACTNPSWIAESMPLSSTEGGFTSRVIFVYEEESRFHRHRGIRAAASLVDDLIHDLTHISTLSGQFQWTDEADLLYKDIYADIRAKGAPDDHRVAGYYARKDIHILKVSMLLSLADRDTLIVEKRDVEAALALLELVEEKMPRTFAAMGKYEYSSELERVYAQIARAGAGGMALSQLYESNYSVGVPALQEIIASLGAMGRVAQDRKVGVVRVLGKAGPLGSH